MLASRRQQTEPELVERATKAQAERFAPYRFAPKEYMETFLGVTPWSGTDEAPGQQQILDAYTLALRQLHARDDYEQGRDYDSSVWQPGMVIQNWIRGESGHTTGKTKILSSIVNHFYDCFEPSIVYAFAPSWDQIHDLLFKEIKADRAGKGLPGRILDLALIKRANWFVKGRATNNAGGQGTERAQGQHGRYLLFILDEAEGIPDFVFNAVKSMASGGIAIVILMANPRTQNSRFHEIESLSYVKSLRMSCISHPNVIQDREVVPGAVRRAYVLEMAEEHCEVVDAHSEDDYTFEFPWQPGVIYKPDAEFCFRVLGVPPANVTGNTFIPAGRYEAAMKREPVNPDKGQHARLGVDVARFGTDLGTIYLLHAGRLRRMAQLAQLDTVVYAGKLKDICMDLLKQGVKSIHIRIDGGGGFASGVADWLRKDILLREAMKLANCDFRIIEVHFGGAPADPAAYADRITELHAEAAEALKGVALDHPPQALKGDLCKRTFDWWHRAGVAVKRLESKEKFRERNEGRSPDDGDGAVLALAPDHIFGRVFKPAAGGKRVGYVQQQGRS